MRRWNGERKVSSRTLTGIKSHQLSERLASLGIMGVQSTASLKSLNTIVLLLSEGFKEALNWTYPETIISQTAVRLIALVRYYQGLTAVTHRCPIFIFDRGPV